VRGAVPPSVRILGPLLGSSCCGFHDIKQARRESYRWRKTRHSTRPTSGPKASSDQRREDRPAARRLPSVIASRPGGSEVVERLRRVPETVDDGLGVHTHLALRAGANSIPQPSGAGAVGLSNPSWTTAWSPAKSRARSDREPPVALSRRGRPKEVGVPAEEPRTSSRPDGSTRFRA
jgi:hypothetical protein